MNDIRITMIPCDVEHHRERVYAEDRCRWFLDPGALAPWIERFELDLASRRYSRLTISGYTSAARHFSAWMNNTSMPIPMIDANLLRGFADHHCECSEDGDGRDLDKYFRRAKRFYTFLQDIGVAPTPACLPRLTPIPCLMTISDACAFTRAIGTDCGSPSPSPDQAAARARRRDPRL